MPLTGERKRKANRRAYLKRKGLPIPPEIQTSASDRQTDSDPGLERMAQATMSGELPPLTPREEWLVSLVIEGGKTLAQCCREAGFGNGANPGGSIYGRLRSGDLRQHIRARMAALGLLPEVAALKLIEKYDARETRFFPHKTIMGEDGKPLIQTREVDAHGVHLDAALNTLRAFGAFDRPTEAEEEKRPGRIVMLEFAAAQGPSATETRQPPTTTTVVHLDFAARSETQGS